MLLDLLFDKILELMMSETTSTWTLEVEEYSTIKFSENLRTKFSLEESSSTHYETVYKSIYVH